MTARSMRITKPSSGAAGDVAISAASFATTYVLFHHLPVRELRPGTPDDRFQRPQRHAHDRRGFTMRAALAETQDRRGALALAKLGERARQVDPRGGVDCRGQAFPGGFAGKA